MEMNNIHDELPIFVACKLGDWEKVYQEIDENAKGVEYFLQQNKNDQNKTILHYVCALPAEEDELATTVLHDIFDRIDRYEYKRKEWQKLVNLQTLGNDYTALHYAIENKHKNIVEYLMLNGADVNMRTKDGEHDALGLIYDRLHVVMVKLFDQGYNVVKDKYDPENELLWQIHCDFTCIAGVPSDNDAIANSTDATSENNLNAYYRQTTLLAEVLHQQNIKRTPILLHPLVQMFLYHKGKKMEYFIWFSMFYHVLWSILISIFLGCNFNELEGIVDDDNTQSENITDGNSSSQSHSEDLCYGGPYIGYNGNTGFFISFYFCFVLLMWIFTLAKELFEFWISPSLKFYILQFENWGQIIVLIFAPISTILTIILQYREVETGTEAIMARQSIFILNTIGIGVALLLIQGQSTKSESLGVYNQMLVKVFLKFTRFFIAFLPKLIAFLVLFYRLIPQKRKQFYHEYGLGINKILAMIVGEFEYDEMFNYEEKQPNVVWVPAKIVFFIFAVSATIVLQNLLLGLTINDMEKLQRKALVHHLAARLEVIYIAEQILTHDKLISYLEKFRYRRFLNSLLIGNTLKHDTVDCNTDDTHILLDEPNLFTIAMTDLPKKLRKSIPKTNSEETA